MCELLTVCNFSVVGSGCRPSVQRLFNPSCYFPFDGYSCVLSRQHFTHHFLQGDFNEHTSKEAQWFQQALLMKMSLLLIRNLTLGLNDQPQHQTQLADEALQTVCIIISSVTIPAGIWLHVEQFVCSVWCFTVMVACRTAWGQCKKECMLSDLYHCFHN